METNIREEKNNLNKYIGDIRNLRKLDSETINNISNMSKEEIIQILNAYNDVVESFCKFVEYFK